ncbi:MAG TPA: ribose 5-phosphate isomerase B [Solirubrobacteraceae bacterium]|jgi:ribose 5-phosphate isomerase B
MGSKPIAVGCDDAGLPLKLYVAEILSARGHEVTDYGCFNDAPVDYPDVAFAVAEAVGRGAHDRAVLVCGTGIGMAISANKVPGVRAAVAHDTYSAERARKSNNAQVLALGAKVIGFELARMIVESWLDADFGGGHSERKVNKISERERALGTVA